jgi:hypothetical protein
LLAALGELVHVVYGLGQLGQSPPLKGKKAILHQYGMGHRSRNPTLRAIDFVNITFGALAANGSSETASDAFFAGGDFRTTVVPEWLTKAGEQFTRALGKTWQAQRSQAELAFMEARLEEWKNHNTAVAQQPLLEARTEAAVNLGRRWNEAVTKDSGDAPHQAQASVLNAFLDTLKRPGGQPEAERMIADRKTKSEVTVHNQRNFVQTDLVQIAAGMMLAELGRASARQQYQNELAVWRTVSKPEQPRPLTDRRHRTRQAMRLLIHTGPRKREHRMDRISSRGRGAKTGSQ